MSPDGHVEVPGPFWAETDPEALVAEDTLCPELVSHGHLTRALQAAAAELAIDLGILAPGFHSRYAAAVDSSTPDREPMKIYIGISVDAAERVFLIDGWTRRGVHMVSGATADLREVVRAAAAWRRGASLDEIQQAAPFVEVSNLARAHERGPAEAVAEQWRELRARWAEYDRHRWVADLLDAAYAVPVLRQLCPYTSHFDLFFSASSAVGASFPMPQDRCIPHIEPRKTDIVVEGEVGFPRPCGGYRVRYRRGPVGDAGDVLGEADDAESAIALLLAHLPANVGPAAADT